ncbi:MAG: AIR synthase related protein, partial [bacterium]|nr:AIR synthase related protein [bacterium]
MVSKVQFYFKPGAPQPQALKIQQQLSEIGLINCKVDCSEIYFLPEMEVEVFQFAAQNFCDKHLQYLGTESATLKTRLHIRFKRGVTDNLGNTAREMLLQAYPDCMPVHQVVASAKEFIIEGAQPTSLSSFAKDKLYNPLIQDCFVLRPGEEAPEPELGDATPELDPIVETISLDLNIQELQELSNSMTLALDEREMLAIKSHYSKPEIRTKRNALGLPEWPTDIELECLAQTWSEHCHHKIFNARILYQDQNEEFEVDSLFKTYIKGLTEKLNKDYLVSVFHDNAGVVRLHDSYDLVYKVETHNSPSALDPYGGAMTGIVGVDRDPLGTGLGAELLAHVKGYCLGHPDRLTKMPADLLHPKRIRDGVHQGVIDGGNQSGIPLL